MLLMRFNQRPVKVKPTSSRLLGTVSIPPFATFLAPFLALLFFATHTYSFDTSESTTQPQTIVITSGRVEQPLKTVLAATSVITRDDIEDKQLRSVADALASVPGVVIKNDGGPGKLTSVFLRGTNSNHVLVLVDGIRAGSATSGTFAFEQYTTDQIERIEVVRGPASSLYGADALGGVIHIFTRRAYEDIYTNNTSSQATIGFASGEYETQKESLNINFSNRQIQFNATVNRSETEGFDALDSPDPDKDGATIKAGSVNLQLHNGPHQSARFSWLRTDSASEFDSLYGNLDQNDNQQEVFSAQFNMQIDQHWHTQLTAGVSQDISATFNGTKSDFFLYETNRESLSSINHITLSDNNTLTVGFDYLNDEIETESIKYNETSRDNTAVFLNQRLSMGSHTFEWSGRRDENERYATKTTGSLKWAFDIASDTQISASRSTAFKAPTFNDLDYPGYGNPNLAPESAISTELGLTIQANRSTRINSYLFYTEIDDLIVAPAPFYIPENISKASISGWETSLSTSWKNGLKLSGQFTLMDPRDRTAGLLNNNQLTLRPKRIASIDISQAIGRWLYGFEVQGAGERFNNVENTQLLPGYFILNTRVSFQPHESIRLQAILENALDKNYETNLGYNQPGRAVMLRATMAFDLLQ